MKRRRARRRLFFGLAVALWCFMLVACNNAPATPAGPQNDNGVGGGNAAGNDGDSGVNPNRPADDTPATTAPEAAIDPVGEFVILYTNDEHGWMEGVAEGRGAANLMGVWADEGYTPDDDMFLLLSGGDNWTGPAISTWFQGASMVEVMNVMGYRASAVGNHEFDFGPDVLRQNVAAAAFPYLGANIHWSDGRRPTDLGIEPFVVVAADIVDVGLIGLTTTVTPNITKPSDTGDFLFLDYEIALRETVPQARRAGAEVIVVITHICRGEVAALARAVADLDIAVIGGGHCNELFAETVGETIILGGGDALRSYAWAEITFDTNADTILDSRYGADANEGGAPDPTTAAVVESWRALTAAELDEVVGYTATGLARRGPAMQALVTEAWLAAAPHADIALTNLGGLRADIEPGDITRGDIITVLPFNNVIVEVNLTGAQIYTVLRDFGLSTAVAGLRWDGAAWVLADTGTPLAMDETYVVLINDFMYTGGDGYPFADFDPAGYNTGVDWRQPVWDWLLAQESGPDRPVEALLNLP